jgi:hypothetical protein
MKHTIARILMAGGVAGGTLVAGNAAAIDWNVTGFVRQEIAVSLGGENPNNTWGNPWNGRINQMITSPAYGDGSNALAATSTYVDENGHVGGAFQELFGFANGGAGAGGGNWTLPGGANPYPGLTAAPTGDVAPAGEWVGLGAGANTSVPIDCHNSLNRAIHNNLPGYGPRTLQGAAPGNTFPIAFADTSITCDPASIASLNPADNTNFNLFASRLEIDIQAKFNDEFSAYMKFRGYFDAARNFQDGDMGDNYGQASYYGNRRATRLEYNWNDVIVDIPHFYLDWNRGPLWIRVGNQVIAWGEAYFFRTMDVANGLDLRRHLTLGPGAEEYQDQRIASPGIRVSYTFDNGWEVDAFAQMFQPTVLPGQNTPYNVIGMSGARFDDRLGQEDAENSINYGFKLNMPLTEAFTAMVAWVNRRNPDGVFHNADAPTFWAGQVNTGCANAHSDTLNLAGLVTGNAGGTVAGVNNSLVALGYNPMPTLDTRARNMANGCGAFFAPDPYGTPSQQYWQAIQNARLDNRDYLPNVIDQGPASQWAVRDMFGFGQERTFADTYRTVEGFRAAFGPYIQWVGRQFKRENVFMVGGNYLVTSDNEWLDQLIIRGEVSWTPNKRLTNDLTYQFTEVDDVVSSLIFEKYQRLSANFPATYMVAQWMHRTSTDLFGRDLDNNDAPGISTFIDPVTGNFTAAAFDPDAMAPKGTDNANYVVFAFQQPFPNLIWRFDFAVLVDVAGGYLIQPGVRYRPSAKWQWDFYSTIIESPGGQNDTITETLDWADEFFVRLTYFF